MPPEEPSEEKPDQGGTTSQDMPPEEPSEEKPDQSGTTSQGWTDRDTERREKFKKLHGVPEGELEEADQQPTDPNAQQP